MASSRATPPAASIGTGEVHLWRFALAASRSCARASVCDILSTHIGVHPAKIEFQQGRRDGRPILAPGLCPGLSFNLSHSGRSALLAITNNVRMGVDIERTRPGIRIDDLIRRFFSELEIEGLIFMAPKEREMAFFRTWVRKEAYLKAVGGGVPAGLRRFSVSVAPDAPSAILSTELEDGGVSAFSLYDIDVLKGYVGALAVEGTGHLIRYMNSF